MPNMWKPLLLSLLISTPVISFAKENPCPPADLIKPMQFVRVKHYNGMWYLISPLIKHHNRDWTVVFGTVMLDATTPEAALPEGQAYFDRSSISSTPTYEVYGNGSIQCTYVARGEKYFVWTFDRPVFDD